MGIVYLLRVEKPHKLLSKVDKNTQKIMVIFSRNKKDSGLGNWE